MTDIHHIFPIMSFFSSMQIPKPLKCIWCAHTKAVKTHEKKTKSGKKAIYKKWLKFIRRPTISCPPVPQLWQAIIFYHKIVFKINPRRNALINTEFEYFPNIVYESLKKVNVKELFYCRCKWTLNARSFTENSYSCLKSNSTVSLNSDSTTDN